MSILDGKGTRMPGFRDRLSADEAWAIVAHIRQVGGIRGNLSPEGDNFQNQFRELQRELEQLQKQVRSFSDQRGRTDWD